MYATEEVYGSWIGRDERYSVDLSSVKSKSPYSINSYDMDVHLILL
jgi:hypothetical protein